MTEGLGLDDGARAVTEARRLFRRTMATWVSDLLVLRRSTGGVPKFAPHDPEAMYGRAA